MLCATGLSRNGDRAPSGLTGTLGLQALHHHLKELTTLRTPYSEDARPHGEAVCGGLVGCPSLPSAQLVDLSKEPSS